MSRAFGMHGARGVALVVLAGAMLITGALCGGAVIMAQQSSVSPREVPMEVAMGGPTGEEMLAQQRNLHQSLMGRVPTGTLDHQISVKLTENEALDLRRAMEAKEDPYRVGIVKSVGHHVSFASVMGRALPNLPAAVDSGMFRATNDGGFVWAVTVRSEGAVGIRVHFANVDLPDDADLFIMNLAGEAFGPYSRRGPADSGEFWSNTVSGDTAIVMLVHRGPGGAADLGRSGFSIADVGHVGPGFRGGPGANGGPTPSTQSFCGFNATCVVNASCNNGTPAEPAKSAVALGQWISGAYIYTCTGGLIADSDTTTQIPYFLTANHCLSSSRTAQSLETYFQFTIPCGSTSCPAQTNPGGIQRLGATVKATGTGGDFTLLQLSQTPPAGSIFLGWNNAAIANTNNASLYRISHPAWAPQAYSAHHVDTGAPTCTGWPRGERIYSRDDAGATEGGSSGSPVVNSSSQIVGQLSGACGYNTGDPCDKTSNATVDGAFAYYYSSVAPYLAGGGTCGSAGATCTANSQCCSNSCKGKAGAKTCR